MKKSSDFSAILKLILLLCFCILTMQIVISAQKTEHYNSPLYSPKTYDPTQTGVSNGMPTALKSVGIEQKLNEQLPLDAEFKNEDGNLVKLDSYFNNKKPVILALVYYECPMLCNEVLNGLTGSLKGMSLDAGKDFDVVAISFDARENEKPDLAKIKKARMLPDTGAPEQKMVALSDRNAGKIDKVTKAVGFNYNLMNKPINLHTPAEL